MLQVLNLLNAKFVHVGQFHNLTVNIFVTYRLLLFFFPSDPVVSLSLVPFGFKLTIIEIIIQE